VIFRMLGYDGNVLNYVSGDEITVAGARVRHRMTRRKVSA
jgi:hypothetical protein